MALKYDYPELIGGNYDPNQILIRSADINRTIMSAYSQMYGVYVGTGPSLPDEYPAQLAAPPYDDQIITYILNDLDNAEAIPNNF